MKPWLMATVLVTWLQPVALAPTATAALPVHSSFDVQVPVAPTPVRVADTQRLVYELHLRNFANESLVLQRAEVLTDDGDLLAEFHDDALLRGLGHPGAGASVANSDKAAAGAIPAGAVAVLYLELPIATAETPRALRHRLTYSSARSDTPITVDTAPVALTQARPLVLSPPLRGGPWAAIYEPSWERGHRRVLYAVDGRARIPGRFAIDWIRLDEHGRKAVGDQDRIANWHGYAADVLAVADAVVASVRDDVAESATVAATRKNALGDATGNYIALDLGNGRYAFYEHLKPGSVRVAPGQRVRRGQTIGALGFTGDSSGPHLHFHVADANSPLGAEGMPYVLTGFEQLGSYESLDQFGRRPWTPRDEATAPRRRAELPAPNSVIMFEASAR